MGGRLLYSLSGAVGGALLASAGGSEDHASKDGEGEYFFHFHKKLVESQGLLLPEQILGRKFSVYLLVIPG